MEITPTIPEHERPIRPQSSTWLVDIAAVLALTAIIAVLAVHFELSERFLFWAAENENHQVDEWPGILLTFAAGSLWFSWRRYREARRESMQRKRAEAQLGLALSENRRLARANVDLQEQERRTFARELHDELGQTLNAIKIDAVTLRNHTTNDATQTARAAAIIHSVDQVHHIVTGMIRRLRPVGLDDLGLEAALEHCVDSWRERLPGTRFHLEVPGDLPDLGEHINMSAFRIVQEALTNIAKHARATDVNVALRIVRKRRDQSLNVEVRDNGEGSDLDAPTPGLGLIGMRERVQALGGDFRIRSVRGDGFAVIATLPLRGHEPELDDEEPAS